MLGSFNNFGVPPARLREILDRNGLRAPSTHVSGNALDELERQIDDAQTLGHQYIVVASLPIAGRPTLDDYRRWADRLNESGQRALRRGVRIGFHNHASDLAPIDGAVPYDLLVERTDPSLVRLQLDTGNLAMAGRDPLEYMKRFGSRYWLFHIKDVPRLGATSDTELGQGVIDFRRVLASIDDIDEKLLFVEQETYPGAPLESIRRDYAYIAALEF
jgi:sugar phosphate isomerase/epimerase